jgi:hypothetical protein
VNVVPPHTWTKRKELVVAVSSATAKRTTRNVEFTLPSRDRLRPLLNGEVRAGMTVESVEPVPDHRGVTRRNSLSGGRVLASALLPIRRSAPSSPRRCSPRSSALSTSSGSRRDAGRAPNSGLRRSVVRGLSAIGLARPGSPEKLEPGRAMSDSRARYHSLSHRRRHPICAVSGAPGRSPRQPNRSLRRRRERPPRVPREASVRGNARA